MLIITLYLCFNFLNCDLRRIHKQCKLSIKAYLIIMCIIYICSSWPSLLYMCSTPIVYIWLSIQYTLFTCKPQYSIINYGTSLQVNNSLPRSLKEFILSLCVLLTIAKYMSDNQPYSEKYCFYFWRVLLIWIVGVNGSWQPSHFQQKFGMKPGAARVIHVQTPLT